jgi:hypothetical protein
VHPVRSHDGEPLPSPPTPAWRALPPHATGRCGMKADIAQQIADETRKRLVERDRYPVIMQAVALDAIVSDLADQIRAALHTEDA